MVANAWRCIIRAQRVSAVICERSAKPCRDGEEPGHAHIRIALDMKEPGHVPRLRITDPNLWPSVHPSNRAYSPSIKLSSSFLKSAAGGRSACPAGSSLFAQVPMAPLWS